GDLPVLQPHPDQFGDLAFLIAELAQTRQVGQSLDFGSFGPTGEQLLGQSFGSGLVQQGRGRCSLFACLHPGPVVGQARRECRMGSVLLAGSSVRRDGQRSASRRSCWSILEACSLRPSLTSASLRSPSKRRTLGWTSAPESSAQRRR